MTKTEKWDLTTVNDAIDGEINLYTSSIEKLNKDKKERALTKAEILDVFDDNSLKIRLSDGTIVNKYLAGIDHTRNEKLNSYLKGCVNKKYDLEVPDSIKNSDYVYLFEGNKMAQEEIIKKDIAFVDYDTVIDKDKESFKACEVAQSGNGNISFKALYKNLTNIPSSNNIEKEQAFMVKNKNGEKEAFSKKDLYDTIAYGIIKAKDSENFTIYENDTYKSDTELLLDKIDNGNFSSEDKIEIKKQISISLIEIKLQELDRKIAQSTDKEIIKNGREYKTYTTLLAALKSAGKYQTNYNILNGKIVTYDIYSEDGTIKTKTELLEVLIDDEKRKTGTTTSSVLDFVKNSLEFPSNSVKETMNSVSTDYKTSGLIKDRGGLSQAIPKTINNNDYSLKELLEYGLIKDINNYLQFNSDRMIEFDLTANKYYSSVDAYIFFNGVRVSEITSIQWTLGINSSAIFGYASYTYDAYAEGTRFVAGEFTVNFTKSNYIKSVLKEANDNSVIGEDKNEEVNSIYAQLQNIKDNQERSDMLKKILAGVSEEDIKKVASEYDKKLWGRSEDYTSKYNRAYLEGNDSIYKDKGFDIVIPWGNTLFDAAGITSENSEAITVINDVHITGENQQVIVGPDNIQQKYTFIAKDLNNSLMTTNQRYFKNV